MSEQPTLFDPPPASSHKRRRHRTASTSSDALDDARQSGRLNRTRRQVLEALREHGPMTRHEIADATGLPLSSVCGRVNELAESGEVKDLIENGRKVVRNGRHVVAAVIQTTRAA